MLSTLFFIYGGALMDNENVWRIDKEHGVLYTENKDVWQRINRYQKKRGFELMAEYFDPDNKRFARQYRFPYNRNTWRIAERLSKL